jgi:hypothetical protein
VSFREKDSAEQIMSKIDKAIQSDDMSAVHSNLKTLVALHGTKPEIVGFLQTTFDRLQVMEEAKKVDAAISQRTSYENNFRFRERLERISDTSNRLSWGLYNGYVPRDNAERAIEAAAAGLVALADRHKRDKSFIPVFDRLIETLADRHLVIAQKAAHEVKEVASPTWLGNVGIVEDMALTKFYRLKQPLKRAAMQALLRIADKAMTRGNFELASQAAYGAQQSNARDLDDINVVARQKGELIDGLKPRQLNLELKPA